MAAPTYLCAFHADSSGNMQTCENTACAFYSSGSEHCKWLLWLNKQIIGKGTGGGGVT